MSSSRNRLTGGICPDMKALRLPALSLPVLALGCAVPLDGNADSSMHRARVMQSGGQPCFALDGGSHTRGHASQLVMVHVAVPQSAAMARDGRVAWSIGFPPAVIRTLQGDECITYGEEPAGSDSMVVPEELQYGVGYRVMLNTDLMKSGGPENRRYSGEFCLSLLADGTTKVHDLREEERVEVASGDACHVLHQTVGD